MNYFEKYLKYKNKYLLLKNKKYTQIGGSNFFIVDPNDDTLKDQKTFPYNDIKFDEEYGVSFPEKHMLLWLKEKTEDILINPKAPLSNENWDATKPNGLAYWMRLYPWGHGFTSGRNVLLDNPKCHSLFPPDCSYLDYFESKIKSKDLAESLGINVARQITFLNTKAEELTFNDTIAMWCVEADDNLFFVVKPTSLALSEGVLIVTKNRGMWSFSVPPLALTTLWAGRFNTQEKLSKMIEYVKQNSNLRPFDISTKWCELHEHVNKKDWLVQELLPRVMEFHNQPMEIKAYVLGGYVWYAIHYVQPTTGSYIKYPFYYRKLDTNWNCIKPPKTTQIIKDSITRELTDEESTMITVQLGKLVSEKLALAAETIARSINVKFTMRADFFIVPDKKHIKYTNDGPVWSLDSLANVDDLNIYFNEMQHWYGKALFLEEYGNMFLYPIFQRTVNRLLKIGC